MNMGGRMPYYYDSCYMIWIIFIVKHNEFYLYNYVSYYLESISAFGGGHFDFFQNGCQHDIFSKYCDSNSFNTSSLM